jgi:hypothetical protein
MQVELDSLHKSQGGWKALKTLRRSEDTIHRLSEEVALHEKDVEARVAVVIRILAREDRNFVYFIRIPYTQVTFSCRCISSRSLLFLSFSLSILLGLDGLAEWSAPMLLLT